jgi:hypothetical protein
MTSWGVIDDAIVDDVKVLSQNLQGNTEKNHEIQKVMLQFRLPGFDLRSCGLFGG